jgi:hypothetical protein
MRLVVPSRLTKVKQRSKVHLEPTTYVSINGIELHGIISVGGFTAGAVEASNETHCKSSARRYGVIAR